MIEVTLPQKLFLLIRKPVSRHATKLVTFDQRWPIGVDDAQEVLPNPPEPFSVMVLSDVHEVGSIIRDDCEQQVI